MTPRRPATHRAPRFDRLHPWIAALSSALLHLLFVLLLLSSTPITMSNPDGAAGGSRMEVEFIDVTHAIPSPPEFPTPPRERVPPRPDADQPPSASRLQVVQVEQAEDPLPPDADDEPQDAATPPPASARPAPRRQQHAWGQPPGMLAEDHAPVNAGPAPSPAAYRGRRYNASAAEPNMEVGGFQVIYDLRSEERIRAWRDEGMTEIFLPLPGARQYMVCPLETALRRESGPCRLVEPDAPEMADIGDAREVINMERVYRRGDLVWKGPGPYR
ncbi:type II toxin-antitoxin system RelE/ParE family toxin [Luteimonas terricola]|uniref:type II toxin-antitoxin system RelE/ParE family toxin n=1 Tax=Luteimonas terricola TaxID=645597 RepID=UPI001048AF25|nr:type II toxin-antitoxin system RelE/ParE family toxin [Luteimonas terricola]